MIRSLNLLVLRCRDLERSRAFYELLGFTFSVHKHGDGPEHLASEDESGVFELYPVAATSAADATGLGFAVIDLQSTRQRFVDGGYAPGEIRDNAWGRSFVVRDPDGRRVEIKQA